LRALLIEIFLDENFACRTAMRSAILPASKGNGDAMAKAIRFHKVGGPEVLVWEDVEVGEPQAGQIRIRQEAVALNFSDLFLRSGAAPVPLPATCGSEAAGVVDAVGPGVTEFKAGDRVAYCSAPVGAYAEARLYPAEKAVKVPDGISSETAAAMMMKGMTAAYLIRRTFKVQPGMTVLFHAAAGGVGQIACQWLKSLGVKVIGTVGSEDKVAFAKAHGCDHVIVYTSGNFVEAVKEITGGKGVPVVYDSVGKTTFMNSLDCLQPLGTMVMFGNASGVPDPLNVGLLGQKGSLFLTRPTLPAHTSTRNDLLDLANQLFDIVRSGKVKIEIGQRYPLKDAARAHQDLAGRKTTGSSVLLP
jgi:NADPH2:quinone reductase